MSYEWAKIPVDLPRKNLILITAKTLAVTDHRGYSNPNFTKRKLTFDELADSGASLRRRPIGLNHANLIDTAFTVDAQFNKKTQALEALCYFPDQYMEIIRSKAHNGERVEFSVEYFFREAKLTESGTEITGACFDRVDLLLGMSGGDPNTSFKLLESDKRDVLMAELDPASLDNGEEPMSEVKLKESKEEKKEEKKETPPVEDPQTIRSLAMAVEIMKKEKDTATALAEAKALELKSALEAKTILEGNLVNLSTKLTESEGKLKGLDEIATKAQGNIVKMQNEEAVKIETAKVEAKKELSEKVLRVLPEITMKHQGSGIGASTVARSVRDILKKEVG